MNALKFLAVVAVLLVAFCLSTSTAEAHWGCGYGYTSYYGGYAPAYYGGYGYTSYYGGYAPAYYGGYGHTSYYGGYAPVYAPVYYGGYGYGYGGYGGYCW